MIFEVKRDVWNLLTDEAKANMGFHEGDRIRFPDKKLKDVKGKGMTLVDDSRTIKVPKKYWEETGKERRRAENLR